MKYSQYSDKLFASDCKSLKLSEQITMSSAYASIDNFFLFEMGIPFSFESIYLIKISMNKLNKHGEIQSPCLVPLLRGTYSVVPRGVFIKVNISPSSSVGRALGF